MYLEAVIVTKIVNTIFSLNMNKAIGHDKIPAYFLKIAPFTLDSFSTDINPINTKRVN